jgi:hypothetical protein
MIGDRRADVELATGKARELLWCARVMKKTWRAKNCHEVVDRILKEVRG